MSRRQVITCEWDKATGWRPDPEPGSLEARAVGCTCPPREEQPLQRNRAAFTVGCPAHPVDRKPE